MTTAEIRELIGKNRIKEAIKEIKKMAQGTEYANSITTISGAYQQLQDDKIMGTLGAQQIAQQSAQINQRLLQTLSNLDEEFPDGRPTAPNNTANNGNGSSTINATGNGNIIIDRTNGSNISINAQSLTNANSAATEVEKQKILFVYSNPADKVRLDFGAEIKKLKKALQTTPSARRDQFEIEVEEAVEANELFRLVRQHSPHYLHISLHASRAKGLFFQDQNGQLHALNNDELADFFELLTMRNSNLQCVVINACNSDTAAETVSAYVPFAIGNCDFMPDEAAITFTRGFYEMIFDGEDVPFAYKAAKLAIKMAKIEAEGDVATHDIPVLYHKK